MKRILVTLTLGLFLAGSASAATAPPYWWYTKAKANKALVALNPQLWQDRDGKRQQTKILTSACTASKKAGKLYRHHYYFNGFVCRLSVRNDTPLADPPLLTSTVFCATTHQKPYGLRCAING